MGALPAPGTMHNDPGRPIGSRGATMAAARGGLLVARIKERIKQHNPKQPRDVIQKLKGLNRLRL